MIADQDIQTTIQLQRRVLSVAGASKREIAQKGAPILNELIAHMLGTYAFDDSPDTLGELDFIFADRVPAGDTLTVEGIRAFREANVPPLVMRHLINVHAFPVDTILVTEWPRFEAQYKKSIMRPEGTKWHYERDAMLRQPS